MSENQKRNLKDGKYHLYIDSKFVKGSLTYADLIIPGSSEKEILISTYICHPSMANDECSGPALISELIRYVAELIDRRFTYRFVLEPETIGAIAYIHNNLESLKKNTIAAFNLSCVGDERTYSIVETQCGDTISDKVLRSVLAGRTGDSYKAYSYLKRGSDERQYTSPGVDIPMVCFCRSKFGEYSEYHTSADNMNLVSEDGFQGSYDVMKDVIMSLENNFRYKSSVLCEAQLGKRGLYPTVSKKGSYDNVQVLLDVSAYANGKRDLIEISEMIGVPINKLVTIVNILVENKILIKNE